MASMDQLWAHANQLPTWAILFIGTTVLFILHRFLFASPAYPAGLPLVAEPPGRTWFSPRTRWRYYTDCASLYSEAYTKVSGLIILAVLNDMTDYNSIQNMESLLLFLGSGLVTK